MSTSQTPMWAEVDRVVFDLDTFVYRCGFASQHKSYALCDHDNMEFVRYDSKKALKAAVEDLDESTVYTSLEVEPVENALHSFKIAVQSVLDLFNTETYCGYLSDGNGFRDGVAVTLPYKGNRDPDAKPVHYKALREYAENIWGAITVSDMEADDACGIAANCSSGTAVICTNDKDLDSVPGWHYNWTKGDDPYWVGKKEASLNFYRQCLSGDPVDNIRGIPGVGPAGAKKVLEGVSSPQDAEGRILMEYIARFGHDEGKAKFLENARLVYILREEEERENPLWQPLSAKAV